MAYVVVLQEAGWAPVAAGPNETDCSGETPGKPGPVSAPSPALLGLLALASAPESVAGRLPGAAGVKPAPDWWGRPAGMEPELAPQAGTEPGPVPPAGMEPGPAPTVEPGPRAQ